MERLSNTENLILVGRWDGLGLGVDKDLGEVIVSVVF